MLLHRFPREDASLKSQTQPTAVDDATYRAGYLPHESSTRDRVVQVVFFILFFGWLRMLIFAVSTLLFVIVLIPLALLSDNDTARRLYLPIAIFFIRNFWLPVSFGCLGIFRVRRNGGIDPRARCCIFNHTSLLDGPLLFLGQRVTIVTHVGITGVPIIGRALKAAETVFIDRSKKDGNSQIITRAMENARLPPLAVAPEGKISNGDYVFRFRTGAFLTDCVLQPVTIRYSHFLPFAGITPNALLDNDLDWFWLCFCCPWASVELNYLEPILPEQLQGRTPQERADMAQLRIANALGTLASARSSREIFEKPKSD
jgi:1-acyl-sn-glycerol-3-phosphate acyltransferase